MQFHHHGYVSTDPRVQPAAGTGLDRPAELPDEMDVLIVGSGPAGMLLAAQLAQYPSVTTRIVERRPGRLAIGQADGIQARSVETFQAFGFAERITAEAYRISEMNFWAPDTTDRSRIVRTARADDDPHGISEFPHLIVNQARVLDYFGEVAATSPARITPDYGWEFVSLEVGEGDRPVTVTLERTDGPDAGQQRTVRARYVVGCDGARSKVRQVIGRRHIGDQSRHAWGVMDVLAVTDFPDIRIKCAIQSEHGSILHIPREGGHLFRMYVDLGEVPEGDNGKVRTTPLETIIAKANAILGQYTLEVKDVAWWSVYEVGHRVTDKFDDIDPGQDGTPHVFICGDACHTHSAKAGQGMNVSMQDGFNLGWKLGSVLTGRAPETLLSTYSAERQEIAQNLIDFDKEWSSLMAKKPEEFDSPEELAEFYTATAEFPAGFMTQYRPSMIVGEATHQDLATGFPVGKRLKSAPVVRIGDAVPAHLGHHARADGRWRIYAFADRDASALREWADWLATASASPVLRFTPADADLDAVFDVKAVYQQDHSEVEMAEIPSVFLPRVGPFGLIDYEKIYAARPDEDIFALRGIDRGGAVVVVRPDQYVAHVLPLSATGELADFFAQHMTEPADSRATTAPLGVAAPVA
ncbi:MULTISPECIES: FAD-binding monooxygenase [Microbacterium]|uniref:FAD-binding monooxygenase n=1 Tax=Microbacterium TaxID=33882 RepID=UPI00214C4721|nr:MULTISPECIES: FAD-binding monooxygenase [unclassified Microbacterium]MCR2813688.1 FAD-binding monooxygenase [Microbacterium sp. zg.Y1084]MDL5488103.1 FAD-binding monooxygenase [Microbacterium sp. zg-Y1211]